MRNIKLTLAYDGTDYNGWQIQKDGITIQGVITEKLEMLCKHKIKLHGAGRTDAGVHAKAQIANFLTDNPIPAEKLPRVLNAILPHDIIVTHAEEVSLDFHARFSAIGKTYRYVIDNGEYPDIFQARFAVHENRKLDLKAMQTALKILVGKHNFKSFCAGGSSVKTYERTIKEARIICNGGLIIMEITADGFLYHMVRNIAGLLLNIGTGRMLPEKTAEIIQAKDRRLAPATAPAKGLCLWKVYY